MLLKYYRVKLIAADLLADIAATEWHKDIVANDLASAWRKFKVQRLNPVYRFMEDPQPIAADYDIRLERTSSV